MNREIKFRAKNKIGWIYGYLSYANILNKKVMCIYDGNGDCIVDIDTIGQFTGLYDKNGKEIYEGDIVLQKDYHGKKIPMAVKFECGAFIVGYHKGSSTKRRPMLLNSQCEVIGNIFDDSL